MKRSEIIEMAAVALFCISMVAATASGLLIWAGVVPTDSVMGVAVLVSPFFSIVGGLFAIEIEQQVRRKNYQKQNNQKS